uniref:CD109 antigen n=1 Tax=Strigamia maritima TaxID=126957 RepID=T1IYG4_STRMM
TYFIVVSEVLRPGHIYRVAVHLLDAPLPVTVKVSIHRDGAEVLQTSRICQAYVPELLKIKVPISLIRDQYKLRVEGNIKGVFGGLAFFNETFLHFSQQSITILIQTDRPVYKQGQTVDVYLLDAKWSIVKRWMSRQNNQGPISLSYELPQQLNTGQWTIRVVAYGQVEEKQFLVKEYYKPRFTVAVKMASFFSINVDNFIHGCIEANYTSGAAVTGNVSLHIAVHPPRIGYSNIKSDPFIEQFIPEFSGVHCFKIGMWSLANLASKLDGMQVTVAATVGDKVTLRNIEGFSCTIVTNGDVKLNFLGSKPQVFKAAAPFKTYVVASYNDNSPLPSYRLKRHRFELYITVVYQNGSKQKLDTRLIKMLNKYIGVWPVEIDLRSEISIDQTKLKDIKYLQLEATYRDNYEKPILSKGLILTRGTETIISSIRTFAVTIQPNMAPSSTIIIYYIGSGGEVIADSITFPVNSFIDNEVSLTSRKTKITNNIEITVKGKAGSSISLSALPRELYLMQAGNEISRHLVLEQMSSFNDNKNKTLIHKHTWLSREGFPNRPVQFPSYSYAPDANRTFEFLSLLVFTDANLTAHEDNCDKMQEMKACLTQGCYNKDKECDGTYDCADWSDERNCAVKEDYSLQNWRIHRQSHTEKTFDDSWLWNDVIIGFKGFTSFNVTVPDKSEQWMISAFSMSKNRGLRLLDNPIQYDSQSPFYLNVEMPSICKLGEQLAIRATVFNNKNTEIEVAVILASSKHYKFFSVINDTNGHGEKRGSTENSEHQHIIMIKPKDSVITHIPIKMVKIGKINVTVMAQTDHEKYTVTKVLKVEADGIPQYRHTSTLLDLNNRAYLISYFDVNLTDTPVIPYRKERYYVYSSNIAHFSVFGDVVGPALMPLPVNSSVLLRQHDDSAEQNLFNFAINLYMMKYLRDINQRNLAVEKKMFHYMNLVYAQQLSYRTEDGAFKPFRWKSNTSVWLTAFCARIFQEANSKDWENFLYIDENVVTDAIAWILKFQTPYGAFFESSVYGDRFNQTCCFHLNEDMDPPRYRNVSLTAHVVLALHSVREMRGELGINAAKAKNLAINYLERMLRTIQDNKDPYDLALLAYTLTVVKSQVADEALNILVGKGREIEGMMYWGIEEIPPPKYNIASNKPYLQSRLPARYDSRNIESTAYTLMVFVAHQALMQEPMVQWLNFQRLTTGGWGSAQNTLVAYQALLEYSSRLPARDTSDILLSVDSSSSTGFEKIFNVNGNNLLKLQTVKIPNAWGTVRLVVKGTGLAVAQLSVQYNVDVPEFQTQPPVPAFSVVVDATYEGYNSSHLRLQSCQSWLPTNESEISGMAVLELEIPTGYVVDQENLISYVLSGKVNKLTEARFYERKIIFYFKHLDSTNTCVNIVAERLYPVANLTSIMGVKVYDLFAPERFNELMYETRTLQSLTICDVCGSFECPNCFVEVSHANPFPNCRFLVLASIMLALFYA